MQLKTIKIIAVSVVVIICFTILYFLSDSIDGKSKSACLDTLASASIVKVTEEANKDLKVDLLANGAKEIQTMIVASTTPTREKFKTAKVIKICYVVE